MLAIINDGNRPRYWWSFDSNSTLLYKWERIGSDSFYPKYFPSYNEYTNDYTSDNTVTIKGGAIQAPNLDIPSGEVFRTTVEGALDDAALRNLAACLSIPQPEVDDYVPPNSLVYFPLENGLDDVMGNIVLSHRFSGAILQDTGLSNRGRRMMVGGSAGEYYTYKHDFPGNNGRPSPEPDDTYNIETIDDSVYSTSAATEWMVFVIDTDSNDNDFYNFGMQLLRQAFGPDGYQSATVNTRYKYNGATGLFEVTAYRQIHSGNSTRTASLDLSSIKNTGLYTLLVAYSVDGTTGGAIPTWYNSFTDTSTDMTFDSGNNTALASIFYNSCPQQGESQNFKWSFNLPNFDVVSIKQAGILTGVASLTELRAMRDNFVLNI